MIDFAVHRTRLTRRIEARQAKRKAKESPEDAPSICEHDWQEFKETVRADNPRFEGAAHFVVMACVKCRSKKRRKLVVET
ncbi:hypothetical protein RhoFasB10_03271 [Rhodococcus sp. B10]|nr:hypothetical protein [Rhodococcus sp. B10]